jgi:hypothetical protein
MFIRAIGEDYVYLDFEGNEGTWIEADNKDLEGIQLTGELLAKLGARKVTDFSWKLEVGVFIEIRITLYSDAEVEIRITRDTPHFTDMCQCNTSIYLHELQNLFWNITKQRLNIKL